MLIVIVLSVVMLSVVMLSVVMLSVVMLSVVMLSVVMLSVVAPLRFVINSCRDYLQPHLLGVAVHLLVGDALVKGHLLAGGTKLFFRHHRRTAEIS
jgi:hypothetical protein